VKENQEIIKRHHAWQHGEICSWRWQLNYLRLVFKSVLSLTFIGQTTWG